MSKSKNILFIFNRILSENDFTKFGFDIFLKHGWCVDIIILQENNAENKNLFYNKLKEIDGINISLIDSSVTFIKKIFSYKKKFYYFLAYNHSYKLFFQIPLYFLKGRKIEIDAGRTPSHSLSSVNRVKLLMDDNSLFNSLLNIYKFLVSTIRDKINVKISNLFRVKAYIAITAISQNSNKKINANNNIVTHMLEYDNYIRANKSTTSDKVFVKKEPIIFIDQALDHHSDFIIHGKNFPVTEEKYWNSLKLFFDKLSKLYDREVLVCPHPKNKKRYSSMNYTKVSAALSIKNCNFVIGHDSTALIHAVLFDKPIIFLTTDEMSNKKNLQNNAHFRVINFANSLAKKVINIDNYSKRDFDKQLEISTSHYEKFIADYIKEKNTDERLFWEIFMTKEVEFEENS